MTPDGESTRKADRNWNVVLGGVGFGILAWVLITAVLVFASLSMEGETAGQGPDPALLTIPVFILGVALIVWPRTRRLGQGFLLGFAIGLVVAGGICIPMVVGASS